MILKMEVHLMSNSVKRFEVFRMFFAIVISLLISFVIIFLVSKEPLTAIYTLITGPFKADEILQM